MSKSFPGWIAKEWECLFCYTYAEPSKVMLANLDEQEVVKVEYECQNAKCRYLKINLSPHVPAIIYPKHVKTYKAFMKAQNKKIERENPLSVQQDNDILKIE